MRLNLRIIKCDDFFEIVVQSYQRPILISKLQVRVRVLDKVGPCPHFRRFFIGQCPYFSQIFNLSGSVFEAHEIRVRTSVNPCPDPDFSESQKKTYSYKF
ncbi:hypothetical protein BpHYR1_000307 [Brachionus plicatilis]|uniref:Uncharacterized protein n=1 Tax=Brachionus plicatilis TaxID=10195 RepID=A0A3M7SHT8_BRAPC|nr:hypothetical protein BpHYR1_000307 [Brachionus plicatilis]